MLTHGIQGCQWPAVVVFCMLGSGLYGVVPDSSIDQFVYSGLVNGLVYNSAAGNVHVSKWHSSMEWESRSMALALEIPHDRALGMKGLAQMVYHGVDLVPNACLLEEGGLLHDLFFGIHSNATLVSMELGPMVCAPVLGPSCTMTTKDHLNVISVMNEVMITPMGFVDQGALGQLVLTGPMLYTGCGAKAGRSTVGFFVLVICFAFTLYYERWKCRCILLLITKSSNWVAMEKSMSATSRRDTKAIFAAMFWLLLLAQCAPVSAVTCRSCFDGIEGCAGGAACLFATRTAANLAALSVAGGAAINIVSLLPASYVRHLPTQVLRTLAAIARVPAAAGPPDMGAMTLNELQESLTGGRIDSTMYKAELSARLADNGTAQAQVARISAMLMAGQSQNPTSNLRSIEGINSYGVLGYLVAAASLIVNSGKRTYSAGATVAGGQSSSSGTSLSIRVPTSGSQFSELLMVWQTLAHAVGAANILATVPFVQQVVWDGISTLGLLWEQAYCLFIIYLEAIEDSQGVLNLANVFAAGAQDTRLKAANQRYADTFGCRPCDEQDDQDKEKGTTAKKWNGKDSPNATKVCKTYNFKDAEHPKQHLYKDGTCKFRHVCMHWVTGKGAGGMCEQNHPKYSCTNPDKTNTKPT